MRVGHEDGDGHLCVRADGATKVPLMSQAHCEPMLRVFVMLGGFFLMTGEHEGEKVHRSRPVLLNLMVTWVCVVRNDLEIFFGN